MRPAPAPPWKSSRRTLLSIGGLAVAPLTGGVSRPLGASCTAAWVNVRDGPLGLLAGQLVLELSFLSFAGCSLAFSLDCEGGRVTLRLGPLLGPLFGNCVALAFGLSFSLALSFSGRLAFGSLALSFSARSLESAACEMRRIPKVGSVIKGPKDVLELGQKSFLSGFLVQHPEAVGAIHLTILDDAKGAARLLVLGPSERWVVQ